MNSQEANAVHDPTNIETEILGEPAIQALEKEESLGLGKIRRDRASHPPSEKGGDDNTPFDPSSARANQTNDASSSSWAVAWDETLQAYYWWNMITNETMWENPHRSLQLMATERSTNENNTTAGPVTAATPAAAPTLASKVYPNNTSYFYYPPHSNTYRYRNELPSQLAESTNTFYAHFNARTGKFQKALDAYRINPERMSIENRAIRQMQYYFDVNAYTEQRNWERTMGTPRKGMKQPLTKKEIGRFKKAKQEKKKKRIREWLCD